MFPVVPVRGMGSPQPEPSLKLAYRVFLRLSSSYRYTMVSMPASLRTYW